MLQHWWRGKEGKGTSRNYLKNQFCGFQQNMNELSRANIESSVDSQSSKAPSQTFHSLNHIIAFHDTLWTSHHIIFTAISLKRVFFLLVLCLFKLWYYNVSLNDYTYYIYEDELKRMFFFLLCLSYFHLPNGPLRRRWRKKEVTKTRKRKVAERKIWLVIPPRKAKSVINILANFTPREIVSWQTQFMY